MLTIELSGFHKGSSSKIGNLQTPRNGVPFPDRPEIESPGQLKR